MLDVILLSVFILNVIMLSVVMLNVVAPFILLSMTENYFKFDLFFAVGS
jgi:hypothetical protein